MLVLFDLSQHFINAAHYWQLPVGLTLNSYGGTLEWNYSYSSRYSSPTSAKADAIMTDGRSQIFYRFDSTGPADRDNKRTLQLIETKWTDELNRPVSRSSFMSLLTRYESIRIRAVYDKTMHQTGIGRVSVESGRNRETPPHLNQLTKSAVNGDEGASFVELCTCPEPSAGSSCEMCAEGFYLDNNAKCVKCPCNGA